MRASVVMLLGRGLCAVVALAFLFAAAPAAAQALTKKEINWTVLWKDIPASQHSVKDSLDRAMNTCSDGTIKPEALRVYEYDINVDGVPEYVVDVRALKGHWNPATCDDMPCVGDDCYLWAYYKKDVGLTQMKTKKDADDPACPATAAANTQCISYCDATVAQCPALFRDVFYLVWNNRVTAWDLYDPSRLPAGRTLAPVKSFGLVLALTLTERASLCSTLELAQNDGKCVKYYQWNPRDFFLEDIWTPVVFGGGTWPEEYEHNLTRWNHDTLRTGANGRGEVMGDGHGIRLNSGKDFALVTQAGKESLCSVPCLSEGQAGYDRQVVSQTRDGCFAPCYKDAAWMCLDVSSSYQQDIFVPNESLEEFSSFYLNPPAGVTTSECARRYTPWVGDDMAVLYLKQKKSLEAHATEICAAIADTIPCDSSRTVSATRQCEGSIGLFLGCGQCNADTRIDSVDRSLTCMQAITCFGPVCPSSSGGGDGGGDCVAGTSKILLPEGKVKTADIIKEGDKIMAFRIDNPLSVFPARVKSVNVTELPTVRINNRLTASQNHLVVTKNRGRIPVDSLQIKDLLLRGDGVAETVTSIAHSKDMETVYTFHLDDADGFVADDILVLSVTAKVPGEVPVISSSGKKEKGK